MPTRRKIIIDTDPGVDDILSLLLALTAKPEEVDVLLISLTYGNVEVEKCVRNVVSLFAHIDEEMHWRKGTQRRVGFETMLASPPLVAVGAEKPLADDLLMADYFHGTDGLGGISDSHPHLSPDETWQNAFASVSKQQDQSSTEVEEQLINRDHLFRLSKRPAHEEILNLLREHSEDEITIVAVGPMTNLALAAAQEPKTFLKAQEVVIMGGSIDVPGNITPVAEFNTFADSYAAARVYALTSPQPASTLPPTPPTRSGSIATSQPPPHLAAYPTSLPRRLNLTLFPLDITHKHTLSRSTFNATVEPLKSAGSPLAMWVDAFVSSTFRKVESLRGTLPADSGDVGLEMHDPLCVWYCLEGHKQGWEVKRDEDLRVETSGQWTRGMYVADKRDRAKRDGDDDGDNKGDTGNWLSSKKGNRLGRCVMTPGGDVFAKDFLGRVFS